jgi:hypothetical protein
VKHLCNIPIANRNYGVYICLGRLYFNGREQLSITDHDTDRIYVSDEVPLEDRPRVVAQAVTFCWRYLTRGLPTVPLAQGVNAEEDSLFPPEPPDRAE